jgi:hypothetical protein
VRFFYLIIVIIAFALTSMTPSLTMAQDKKCSGSDARLIRDYPNDTVEILGRTIYAGTLTTDNQTDAVIASYIGTGLQWCWYYDTSRKTNSEALELDEWGGRIFVTIAVNNGNSDELNAFAVGGWIPSYGLGAGPRVGVILEIDPLNYGQVLRGTYVISKTADGLTNTVIVHGTQFWDYKVFITGIASSYILDALGEPFHYTECPRGSGFRYTLDYDMTKLMNVECNEVSTLAEGVLRNTGEIPENLQEPLNPGGGFFAYCTNNNGIQVVGLNGEAGYELFTVPTYRIGDGLQLAVETGQNVKLAENGIVSLWALSTDELQLHTTEPYDFIFSKYRCGEPFVSGMGFPTTASSTLSTTLPAEPDNALPSTTSSLPIYRPSALRLNEDGTYTIRSGDTLNTIAAKLGVDVNVLADLNNIDRPRFIQVGQILDIPES